MIKMKISEKELKKIVRECIMESISNNNSLSDDVIIDDMDTHLMRLKHEYTFVEWCISELYPRFREIILEVLSKCGISYSNITYDKYDDNVYMLIFNNCDVNIQQFINATNSSVEDYDFSDASQIIKYLRYDGGSELEWLIKDECKVVREFSIYDISFSDDCKTCAIYIKLPFNIKN